MARSFQSLGYIVALSLAFSVITPAHAQLRKPGDKKGGEFIPGTVASIEKEKTGKNYKLKIKRSDDETELDVNITSRTALFITAPGDEGFIRPGVFVETKATSSNQNLFADDFTVYLGVNNMPGRFGPDKEVMGSIDLCGQVTETQKEFFMVRCPQVQKINYDKDCKFTVKIADASMIKEGDEITVEGSMVKGKKPYLNGSQISVTQKDAISSEEYWTAQDEKRKPKSSAKAKATAKTKGDGEAVGGVPATKDPFGVLPGKKPAKEKADDKKPEDKKTDDKKEEVKKDAAKQDDAKKEEPKKADDKKAEEKAKE